MSRATQNKPTYVILGATGATGSQVLTQLLNQSTDSIEINVYARSLEKLTKTFPDLERTKNVSVFTGPIDSSALTKCLDTATVIINTIGATSPAPDVRVAQDTAEAIIRALKANALKRPTDTRPKPHLVYLSSASLTKNGSDAFPWIQKKLVYNGLWYLYRDIELAISYYKTEGVATGLLDLSLACPGALMNGPKSSNVTDLRQDVKLSDKTQSPTVTYEELAKGMIDISKDKSRWIGKEVIFTSAHPPAYDQLALLIIKNVLPGLIITFIPSLYPLLTALGIL